MKYIFYEAIKDTQNSVFAQQQNAFQGRVHFHRAFEITYICDGQAGYLVEDQTFYVQKHDIVFAHCYYRHQSNNEYPHSKYVIAIPEKLSKDISDLFRTSTLPCHMHETEFNRTLFPYFEKLILNPDMSTMLAVAYVNIIVGTLAEHYALVPIKPKCKHVAFIASILEYIDVHYADPITLETIATQFGYNKAYFSRLFNKYINMSLSNYINMVRYDHFKEQYHQNTGENLTQLIFNCGFTSTATFYRIHKYRNEQSRRYTIGNP